MLLVGRGRGRVGRVLWVGRVLLVGRGRVGRVLLVGGVGWAECCW